MRSVVALFALIMLTASHARAQYHEAPPKEKGSIFDASVFPLRGQKAVVADEGQRASSGLVPGSDDAKEDYDPSAEVVRLKLRVIEIASHVRRRNRMPSDWSAAESGNSSESYQTIEERLTEIALGKKPQPKSANVLKAFASRLPMFDISDPKRLADLCRFASEHDGTAAGTSEIEIRKGRASGVAKIWTSSPACWEIGARTVQSPISRWFISRCQVHVGSLLATKTFDLALEQGVSQFKLLDVHADGSITVLEITPDLLLADRNEVATTDQKHIFDFWVSSRR